MPTLEVESVRCGLRVRGVVDTGGVAFSLLLGIPFDEWPALLRVILRGIMRIKTVVEDHVSGQITQ